MYSDFFPLISCAPLQVETIGDAYMVVGGVPIPKDTHAERVANFALGMRISAREVKNPITGQPIQVLELICVPLWSWGRFRSCVYQCVFHESACALCVCVCVSDQGRSTHWACPCWCRWWKNASLLFVRRHGQYRIPNGESWSPWPYPPESFHLQVPYMPKSTSRT